MSLSETKVTDKIEVLETGHVQVREALRVMRDGEVIAQTYNRFVVAPGEATEDMDAKVLAICSVVHTQEVISTYQAKQAAAQAALQPPQE